MAGIAFSVILALYKKRDKSCCTGGVDVLGSDARLKNHPLWVAHYTSAAKPRIPAPWSFWTFWQYTDRGRVAGIAGGVDINRFNGDRGRLEALLIQK